MTLTVGLGEFPVTTQEEVLTELFGGEGSSHFSSCKRIVRS